MLALLFATVLAARDAAAQGSHGPHEFTAPIMGVDVRIVIHGGPHEEAAASAEAAFERVRALNRIFSDYEPASESMRLAAHAGDGTFVQVSPELERLLLAGRSLSNASAFCAKRVPPLDCIMRTSVPCTKWARRPTAAITS